MRLSVIVLSMPLVVPIKKRARGQKDEFSLVDGGTPSLFCCLRSEVVMETVVVEQCL